MHASSAHVIESRSDFQQSLRSAFADLADHGPREIVLCDVDFADWPLNDPQVIEQLSKWAKPHRICTVLALNYDRLRSTHPRWVQWRQTWSHVVHCRTPDEADREHLPCLLLAPGCLTLRLLDRTHHRGSVSLELADAVRARDRIDALLQRSSDAFPASTLGL